jgi:hypothetical protein
MCGILLTSQNEILVTNNGFFILTDQARQTNQLFAGWDNTNLGFGSLVLNGSYCNIPPIFCHENDRKKHINNQLKQD